jgi:hypothetical protein
MLRHHQLQDRVAQKFQALIVKMVLLGLVSHAGMSERFRQQERIAEFVADTVFERIHGTENLTATPRLFQLRPRRFGKCHYLF